MTDYESILYQIEKHPMICYSVISAEVRDFAVSKTLFMETKSIQSYNNSFEQLVKDLTKYQKKDYRIVVASPSVTRAKRLSDDLRQNGLVVTYDKDFTHEVEAGQIVVTAGKLLTGIEYPAVKWVLISEGDIFKGRKEKQRRKKEKKKLGRRFTVLQISTSGIMLFMKNTELVFIVESKRSRQMVWKKIISALNIRAEITYLS